MYHLHRALNAGRIDLDRFLRVASPCLCTTARALTTRIVTDNSGARRRAIHEARAHRAHPDLPSHGRVRPSGVGLSWIRARRYHLIYTMSHAHMPLEKVCLYSFQANNNSLTNRYCLYANPGFLPPDHRPTRSTWISHGSSKFHAWAGASYHDYGLACEGLTP